MARSPSLRAVSIAALISAAAAPGAASQQPAPRAPARFDGHDATEWAQQLLGRGREAAVITLAAGHGDSLPVLRELLVHDSNDVTWAAARTLELMGPAAAPLADLMLQQLRAAPSWWTQMHCGNALAAAGIATPDVRAALLQHVTKSDVVRLRAECAIAFARLDPDPVKDLLAAFERGDFDKREYAVEALVNIDDLATSLLVTALRERSAHAELAEEVMLRRGWRVVPALERAGLNELAQRVLIAGPLRRVTFGEDFVAELKVQPVPLERLPVIEWAIGAGHGDSLEVCRAIDGANGVRVVSMRLVQAREPGADTVVLRTAVVPRATASVLSRQLAVLPCIKLGPREPQVRGRSSGKFSSADFVALVRAMDGERVVVDGAFCSYPTSGDIEARFVPQAAVAMLGEALRGADWEPYEVDDDDRDTVKRLVARLPDVEWATTRGKRLLELLAPR